MNEEKDKNIQRLRDYGFSDKDIFDIIKQLQEDVSISLVTELLEQLDQEEFDQFDKSLESLSEIDRISAAAELYQKKKGYSPVEGAMVLLEKYLDLMATSLETLKDFSAKLTEAKKSTVKKLLEAINNGEWKDIKPILDEIGFDEKLLVAEVK